MPRCRRSSLAETSDGNDDPARGLGVSPLRRAADRPSRSCHCATAHQLAMKQTVICVANAARMCSGAKRTGTRFATPRRASCT